jgi:hypothetical protein
VTAIFEGVSAKDFRKLYLPICESMRTDNKVGKLVFYISRQIQGIGSTRYGVLRMVSREQQKGGRWRMSMVLWDMFTGAAPYREVFLRTLHPAFWIRFLRDTAISVWPHNRGRR